MTRRPGKRCRGVGGGTDCPSWAVVPGPDDRARPSADGLPAECAAVDADQPPEGDQDQREQEVPPPAERLGGDRPGGEKRPARHHAATRERKTTAYTLIPPGPAVANTGTWTPMLSPPLAKVTAATSSVLGPLSSVVPCAPFSSRSPWRFHACQADFRPRARRSSPRYGMADSGRKVVPNAAATARATARTAVKPAYWRV